MNYFVDKDSIVRKIWGNGDTILMVFAGASAEFALNKAVDWLYFTGKLPADPLKRLFSTVTYARKIVFSSYDDAMRAIDQITAIHQGVEQARGQRIPDWAYRDVLYMLIDYSIRSYELLERALTPAEKEELYQVLKRIGERMEIPYLPENYKAWTAARTAALNTNLVCGDFSKDLYKQYRKHLGWFRFCILKLSQMLLVPSQVNKHLRLGYQPLASMMLAGYKISRLVRLKDLVKNAILPPDYKQEIIALDIS